MRNGIPHIKCDDCKSARCPDKQAGALCDWQLGKPHRNAKIVKEQLKVLSFGSEAELEIALNALIIVEILYIKVDSMHNLLWDRTVCNQWMQYTALVKVMVET